MRPVECFAISAAALLVACSEPPASSGSTPSTSAAAEGPTFTAAMTAAKSYKATEPASVEVVVDALGPYHVNDKYPFRVKLSAAPDGVTYPATDVKDVQRTEKRATIKVPFTPTKPGSYEIKGTCSLSVCTDERCVIEEAPVSATVRVE